MSKKNPNNNLTLIPSDKNILTTDARTKFQCISFTITYPSGVQGLVIVGRMPQAADWEPTKDIKSINVEFHDKN